MVCPFPVQLLFSKTMQLHLLVILGLWQVSGMVLLWLVRVLWLAWISMLSPQLMSYEATKLLISDNTSSLVSFHSYIWHCGIIFRCIWIATLILIQPSSSCLNHINTAAGKTSLLFSPLCQEGMMSISMDMFPKTKMFPGSLLTELIIHLFPVEYSYLKQQNSLQKLHKVAAVYVDMSDGNGK